MKKSILICFLISGFFLLHGFLFAQQRTEPQKIALVIGNGAYSNLSRLANPVNDANDVAAALQNLGFVVERLIDVSLDQMDDAVLRLKNNLSESKDSYGFFFYAGHGVQLNGENYLIPVDANIPAESFLRSRSLSVQTMLDELNDARNSLNVVVLDACRDNPFGWGRSTGRGLALVTHQPADSIIVYATSAGQIASDGTGRNGLFTSQFLPNLTTPGIEVAEVFRRTGADVSEASNRQQIPAVYNQFFGIAYLGDWPEGSGIATGPRQPVTLPQPARSRISDRAILWSIGAGIGTAFIDPLLIVTVHGTISPFRNLFLEAGCDIGFLSKYGYVNSLFCAYPFIHAGYFLPFKTKGGAFAGAGGGVMVGKYKFSDGGSDADILEWGIDFTAGVNLFNFLNIAYTLRTNFVGASHKASVGYVYRIGSR